MPRSRPTNTGKAIVVEGFQLYAAVEHVTHVLHALPCRVRLEPALVLSETAIVRADPPMKGRGL
jgi:hypothetical protein